MANTAKTYCHPATFAFLTGAPNTLFDYGFTGHVSEANILQGIATAEYSAELIPVAKRIGEHLPYFDLINMNGRVYDPQLGRFLSPDPYVQAPDFTQNYNRYSYVLNNPLKYTDPSGYYRVQSEDEQQRSEDMVGWGYFSSSSYGGSYMIALMEYEEQQAINEFFSNNTSSGFNTLTTSNIIEWSLDKFASAPENSYTYYNFETGDIYQYDLSKPNVQGDDRQGIIQKIFDDFFNNAIPGVDGGLSVKYKKRMPKQEADGNNWNWVYGTYRFKKQLILVYRSNFDAVDNDGNLLHPTIGGQMKQVFLTIGHETIEFGLQYYGKKCNWCRDNAAMRWEETFIGPFGKRFWEAKYSSYQNAVGLEYFDYINANFNLPSNLPSFP